MVRTVTPSFPGHCLVKVAGKGLVPMQAIRIGDKVEAYDVHRRISCWSPVTAFMHREPRKSAPYLVLGYSHTLGSGLKECGSVTISADHLVFLIEKGDMVPAGSVQLGQHLLVCHDGHMIMAEASGSMATMGQGFYSPITHIGTIVVDGIVAFAGHQHWWNRLFHRRPDNTPLRYARTPLMVNTPAVVAPVAVAPPALIAPMTPTAGLTRTVYPLSPIATTTYTPTATATTTAFHYPTSPTAMIPMSPTATAYTAMTFQHPASPTMHMSYPAVGYPAALDTTTTTVQHPTVTDTTHLAYPTGDQQIVTKSTTKTETLTTADVRPVSAPIDFNFDLDGLDTVGSFTTLPATVVA